MKQEQSLFLDQARSAFEVYEPLRSSQSVHHCHALHYLQMATELLGKAHAWKDGPVPRRHNALVPFLRGLSSNKEARLALGYEGRNDKWKQTIRKIIPIADSLQNLAPALANDGPNPEYPWPPSAPTISPVNYEFPIWDELTKSGFARKFISIVAFLFEEAESYMS